MAKLTWNRVGERIYQTGVDRGVLYPPGGVGVAWNGLTSVSEEASGGDPRAYYIDGYLYSNRASREDFAGTIEAFTYPKEFEICDGTKSVGRGLHFGQQRRRSFGMSYRTIIGNDLAGIRHGYKLHLVYNALAKPTNKSFNTMSDSPDAITFSWSFSTKPMRVAGYRPVPHVVVDSTETQVSLLSALEDIIYGSESTAPRLPAPAELITLFSGWPEMLVVDNGDGTFTVDGPDDVVSVLNSTTFQITSDAATNNGNGTYSVSSL
jgi:hypothetical protein